jgi:hypothetical protein
LPQIYACYPPDTTKHILSLDDLTDTAMLELYDELPSMIRILDRYIPGLMTHFKHLTSALKP